jgi:AcrR family transcriptional regulator
MTASPVDPAPAGERRPGRPRDARADAAILDAAVSVLAEVGAAGFTVDAVAARAGCGKATIYRRWPSRTSLLLDTAHQMGLEPSAVDTGSVERDLVSLMTELGRKLRETETGRILPSVVAEAAVRPDMKAVLAEFVHDRRERPREVVRRAIQRGELPADIDVELLLDLLGGTVIYRELIACRPTDEAFVARLVAAVLPGFVGPPDRDAPAQPRRAPTSAQPAAGTSREPAVPVSPAGGGGTPPPRVPGGSGSPAPR